MALLLHVQIHFFGNILRIPMSSCLPPVQYETMPPIVVQVRIKSSEVGCDSSLNYRYRLVFFFIGERRVF